MGHPTPSSIFVHRHLAFGTKIPPDSSTWSTDRALDTRHDFASLLLHEYFVLQLQYITVVSRSNHPHQFTSTAIRVKTSRTYCNGNDRQHDVLYELCMATTHHHCGRAIIAYCYSLPRWYHGYRRCKKTSIGSPGVLLACCYSCPDSVQR